jgi:hypothetical protein
MRRKRFTEEQIIGILKEAKAGAKSTDLRRRHGSSCQTFWNSHSRREYSPKHERLARAWPDSAFVG